MDSCLFYKPLLNRDRLYSFIKIKKHPRVIIEATEKVPEIIKDIAPQLFESAISFLLYN